MVVRIACCLFLLLGMRTQLAFATAYSCPSSVETPDNEATVLGRGYSISTKSLPSSIDEFLETFRNLTYDDWLKPYDEMKAGMYDFKKKYFAPNLNDGDSIYESACGIGLNLFLTLEILNEISGLESLVVYGSDVVKESVQYANSLFENAPPFRTEKGTICEGDSANLHFVPSNSFDFVYTGFISPILDVLDLGHSFDKNREHLVELCGSRDNDWKARKLSEIAQQRQNDWFAKWVTELVRIAKVRTCFESHYIVSYLPCCFAQNTMTHSGCLLVIVIS